MANRSGMLAEHTWLLRGGNPLDYKRIERILTSEFTLCDQVSVNDPFAPYMLRQFVHATDNYVPLGAELEIVEEEVRLREIRTTRLVIPRPSFVINGMVHLFQGYLLPEESFLADTTEDVLQRFECRRESFDKEHNLMYLQAELSLPQEYRAGQ